MIDKPECAAEAHTMCRLGDAGIPAPPALRRHAAERGNGGVRVPGGGEG